MLQYFVLCCRGCSVQHGHAFPLHFQDIIFFLSFSLRLHLYEFKTYSMVPLYMYFTLLWVPFSQLSIHSTITCFALMYNFPSFVYLGQVFFKFSNLVPIALFCLSTQLLTYELIY